MMILAVVSDRWPFWQGGLAIGIVVVALLLATRNLLGVSSGFADACAAPFDARLRRSWRLPFLLGIVGGGLLGALASGSFAPTLAMGLFDTLVTASLLPKLLIFFAGGILLGFGARLANGCTSVTASSVPHCSRSRRGSRPRCSC